MERRDFEEIIYSDKVEFKKKEREYQQEEGVRDVLVEFAYTPYDILIEKLTGKISKERTEEYKDKLYLRYGEEGDTWELGFIQMDLSFWKYIEDIFYSYKPAVYLIKEDKLERISKGDLLEGEKFFRSELDDFIE